MTKMMDAPSGSPAETLFRGDGEMATLARELDWSVTPVGPIEAWSASLRSIVSTLLASRHPMFLWWGPELTQFYNDAYRQSLGPDRHPAALGARGRECWAEIWPIIGPEVDAIMANGSATWHEDHLVPITRGDRVHDVYWSYSYSPVQDDDGSVGGVLVTVQETTRRVVGERRARLLQTLATELLQARSVDDVCTASVAALSRGPDDVACVLLYLLDDATGVLRHCGGFGVRPGSEAAPETLSPQSDATWPVARALAAAGTANGGIDSAPVAGIQCERWPEPISEAVTTAIAAAPSAIPPARSHPAHGVVILGLNPRTPLDAAARFFASQVAREIGMALDEVSRLEQERAAVHAAAIAERQLLQGAFELSPTFLAILRGPDHVFELANPAYDQLVGHRRIMGLPLRKALPEIQGQGFLELMDRVYASGQPYVGNEVLVALQPAPGAPLEERYLNFVYQPMRGPTGQVSGILVAGADVTAVVEARKAVEQSLRQTEELAAERDAERRQLRTVLEQAPLAIAIFGAAGEIRFANAAFDRLCGEGTCHVNGTLVDFESWAGARAVLRGESIEGEILELVQPVPNSDARRLTVWVSAAPVRNADGGIRGGVVVIRDITAERRTEQQLRDAQRLHAVGTLAGGVAHEVNNALQGALGFGSFVLLGLGPEHPQTSDMRLVLQSIERAARVSQQLLAFTRQQVTRLQPVNLPALTAALRPVLQQLLGADKSLLVTTAGEIPPIEADPAQVEQVLINLVANARDATETGGTVTIGVDTVTAAGEDESTLEMGFRLEEGRYVRLTVSDNGHGMTPATLAHIFDPFFTTKPVGEGAGLGLSMVYGTVKQHGGFIGARSVPGVGTTMELYWPTAAAVRPSPGAGNAAETASPSCGGVVLVADDEAMVRSLVVRTLRESGYTVVAAEDGRAAIEMIEAGRVRPDLVITDVVMPRRNGRQLHDAVIARWPDTPVIFMSGHTGDEAVVQRLVPAGSPYLQKPFTPEVLARTADELCLRRRGLAPR